MSLAMDFPTWPEWANEWVYARKSVSASACVLYHLDWIQKDHS